MGDEPKQDAEGAAEGPSEETAPTAPTTCIESVRARLAQRRRAAVAEAVMPVTPAEPAADTVPRSVLKERAAEARIGDLGPFAKADGEEAAAAPEPSTAPGKRRKSP